MARRQRPVLIDQKTGARMFVPNPPKIGSIRATSLSPRMGPTYDILFANPGRYLKAGSKVTVSVGDCNLTDIVIE